MTSTSADLAHRFTYAIYGTWQPAACEVRPKQQAILPQQQCDPPRIAWFPKPYPAVLSIRKNTRLLLKGSAAAPPICVCEELVLLGSRSSQSSLSSQRDYSWVQFFEPMSAIGIFRQLEAVSKVANNEQSRPDVHDALTAHIATVCLQLYLTPLLHLQER